MAGCTNVPAHDLALQIDKQECRRSRDAIRFGQVLFTHLPPLEVTDRNVAQNIDGQSDEMLSEVPLNILSVEYVLAHPPAGRTPLHFEDQQHTRFLRLARGIEFSVKISERGVEEVLCILSADWPRECKKRKRIQTCPRTAHHDVSICRRGSSLAKFQASRTTSLDSTKITRSRPNWCPDMTVLPMTPQSDDLFAEQRVEQILDWLAGPQAADPLEDLGPLRAHLISLSDAQISGNQFHRILDLFYTRAQKITSELKPQLRDASLPLIRPLRQIAQGLSEIHHSIAAGYQRVLADVEQRRVRNQRRNPSRMAGRAMKALAEQLEIAALVAGPLPPDFWRSAHELYREAHLNREDDAATAASGPDPEQLYREILALATVQPESLSASEVSLAVAYVSSFASAAEIRETLPAEPDPSLFWIDPHRDSPPLAASRRTPPASGKGLLYFSCARLAALAAEQIVALERGTSPEELQLPPEAGDTAYHGLLRRLQQRWTEPAKRQFPRRRNNYRVQVCIGLEALWNLLDHSIGVEESTGDNALTDWMVLNESPAGYALMHVAGEVQALRNGSAIALRTSESRGWQICIVRWMSSDNPEHIELGVQVVAPGAQPIKIAFRNTKQQSRQPLPALLLEPLPALRQNAAILAPTGSCRSRRFVMVSGAEKTYISQGRMVSLDLQTACVELFQFESDPYPI